MADIAKDAWKEINTETLPAPIKAAYGAYKAQYAKAAELREVFEKMVNDTVALPEGKRMAISYRFGKISMAVADVEPAKVSRKAVTLAAFGTK
jgi:hypothetical protein